MNNRIRHLPFAGKNQGFTLIEFIVASVLALIVILAAGSTYFITRKLNQGSLERLDIQQNLRSAAVHLTRDARLAGTFGCYSLGNNVSNVSGWTAPDFTTLPSTLPSTSNKPTDSASAPTPTTTTAKNCLPCFSFMVRAKPVFEESIPYLPKPPARLPKLPWQTTPPKAPN
ncbi:prepilin-type N-terminal cleavage/methylation domain-containing protein [Conchiformibius steedae DSM 2580]|uniref:Prepilin-type N-terminal cleavage/methylation domain-containing protein n=1 Tax=Conchiformibius steedae DSM 2580 TaxID=1121352 RepID=A0AAE9KZT0_9NEIS|nr:prepilin-type N-terminal cleavage/methylation domain-containing protein [Conchiformibius steedae]URD67359.1 prepilin-type N-terminal cleavage/methylation domain-containing protein [Conchiformibius steedae DSM 2580]